MNLRYRILHDERTQRTLASLTNTTNQELDRVNNSDLVLTARTSD